MEAGGGAKEHESDAAALAAHAWLDALLVPSFPLAELGKMLQSDESTLSKVEALGERLRAILTEATRHKHEPCAQEEQKVRPTGGATGCLLSPRDTDLWEIRG
jgi:hypothetical protein